MLRPAYGLFALPIVTSCLIVPENARPELNAGATVATQYNFRGMTNVDAPVLQTDLAVDLPTKMETGAISVRGFANWDLDDSFDDSWFPDDHAGEPSQIDMALAYSETYRGFDFTSGVVSYALQNPDDFPFADERGETKEFFFVVSHPIWWELVPTLRLHYDFDEVDDFYGNVGLARDFPVKEGFIADAQLSVGWSGEEASEWTYGLEEAGLADLQARAGLDYLLDANTTIRLEVAGSYIVDDELKEWFDLIDIDSDPLWASLGVNWAY
jgi:hypothetical protein